MPMPTVVWARVTDVDYTLHDGMSAVVRTRIDVVYIVDAATAGVFLNDSDTHAARDRIFREELLPLDGF